MLGNDGFPITNSQMRISLGRGEIPVIQHAGNLDQTDIVLRQVAADSMGKRCLRSIP